MRSGFLLSLLLSWLMVASVSAVNRTETKSGCQPKCGNVDIPYPFGIGANCSIAAWANINCNTTFNPPKPFIGSLEVTEFSPTEVRIKNLVATKCYDQNGALLGGIDASVSLQGTPYTFSSTKNKLMAVGCDTYVLAGLNNATYTSGCTSLCNRIEYVVEGSCSGIGCCQSSIPKGVKDYYALAGTLFNHTRIWSFDNCSSAFLGEGDRYNFKVSDFANFSSLRDIPIVINFAVGNQTCNSAKQDTTTFALARMDF